MTDKEKLIVLKTKLDFYEKLENKIGKVLNLELELDDWSLEVYYKILHLESEIDDLKIKMDLPDEEW